MKKHFISEAQRLQKLAGITEAKVVPANPLYASLSSGLKPYNFTSAEIQEIVNNINERKNEYLKISNSKPIYIGLNKAINNPTVNKNAIDNILEFVESLNEDGDEDYIPDTLAGQAPVFFDYEIMENFAPQFVQNLYDLGFKFDNNEGIWIIPDDYYNKLSSSDQKEYSDKEITSYGIIWDLFDIDYDTDIRETISDYLNNAALENATSTNEAKVKPTTFISTRGVTREEILDQIVNYWDVDPDFYMGFGLNSKEEVRDVYKRFNVEDLVEVVAVYQDMYPILSDFYKKYNRAIVDGRDYTDLYDDLVKTYVNEAKVVPQNTIPQEEIPEGWKEDNTDVGEVYNDGSTIVRYYTRQNPYSFLVPEHHHVYIAKRPNGEYYVQTMPSHNEEEYQSKPFTTFVEAKKYAFKEMDAIADTEFDPYDENEYPDRYDED